MPIRAPYVKRRFLNERPIRPPKITFLLETGPPIPDFLPGQVHPPQEKAHFLTHFLRIFAHFFCAFFLVFGKTCAFFLGRFWVGVKKKNGDTDFFHGEKLDQNFLVPKYGKLGISRFAILC